MRNDRRLRFGAAIVCLALVGCAPATQTSPVADEVRPQAAAAPAAPKTLTIAQTVAIKGYGPWEFSSTAGGAAALAEIHTTSLVAHDAKGTREARVAARLPSLEDGTVVVLPDGRMETTWTLREGALWQDGTPLTADDLVFSWQMAVDPNLTSSISPNIRHVEVMDIVDPRTVRMTWKTTYFRALDLTHRDFWLFPRHILGEPYERGTDREAFSWPPVLHDRVRQSRPVPPGRFRVG